MNRRGSQVAICYESDGKLGEVRCPVIVVYDIVSLSRASRWDKNLSGTLLAAGG